MNHIYRIIWCAANQCWVAVSELTTASKKSTSKVVNAILTTVVLGSSQLIMAEPVNISGTHEIPLDTQKSDQLTIKNAKFNINTDSDVYKNKYGTASVQPGIMLMNNNQANITIENLDFSLTGSPGKLIAANGLDLRAPQGIEVNISGNNNIKLDHAGADTAVLISSWNPELNIGNGSSTLNISGILNVENKGSTETKDKDGVEINAYNGDATINHIGTGKIEVDAGNAIYAKKGEGTGNININLSSQNKDTIELVTKKDTADSADPWVGHHGISAASYNTASTGAINITTNAKINTNGKLAKGIYSHHKGLGNNIINNEGTILTSADGSHAIHGVIDNIASTAQLKITNSGDLTTKGDNAFGIYADNQGNGDTIINHTGKITTTGLASTGIFVKDANNNTGSKIVVNLNNASISLNDKAASNTNQISHHIDVNQDNQQSGDVDINIQNSQLNSLSSDYGSTAVYIKSQSENGNLSAKIDNTQINMDGKNADGVHLVNSANNATGNLVIRTNNSTISSQNSNGDLATNYGLIARQMGKKASGNIVIENNGGSIAIGKNGSSGNDSAAIYTSFADKEATGNISIINSGTITTHGSNNGNMGIYATNEGLGNTLIQNDGNIQTAGSISSAIHIQQNNVAANKNRQTVVKNTAKLETKADSSRGINVIEKGLGNIDIINSGSILTLGNNAHGIYGLIENASSTGTLSINNTGELTTKGNQSNGIFAVSKGAKIEVANESNINTSGIKSAGVSTEILNAGMDSGGITIVQNYGTIKTSSIGTSANTDVDAAGIRAIVTAKTGDINIKTNNTIINVDGRNSDGIIAQSLDNNTNLNINIETNGGSIDTLKSGQAELGQSNLGIVATQANFATGNINIINNGTKITTGLDVNHSAKSSASIYAAHTGANSIGSIFVNNKGDLKTAGSDAKSSGIYTEHKGLGDITIINSGSISTLGNSAHGIYGLIDNTTSTGSLSIMNTGKLSTKGKASHGIYADNNSSGKSTVLNTGDIHIEGTNTKAEGSAQSSNGILVKNNSAPNGQGIEVNNSGNILTSGYDNTGIRVVNINTNGHIDIVSSGNIHTTGENADGIFANTYTDNSDSNISIKTGQGNIIIGDTTSTEKMLNNFGVVALHEKEGAKGHIIIETDGTNITTNQDKNSTANLSSAVYAGIAKASSTGDIIIERKGGDFITHGTSSHGLFAWNKGSGNIQINNSGTTIIHGDQSHGIYGFADNATSTGKININNTGAITTHGNMTHGIFAEHKGSGDISIANSGSINTTNGIAITGLSKGNVSIINSANINATTKITNTAAGAGTNSGHGLQAISYNGIASVSHLSGKITVMNPVNNHSAHGIAAWGSNSTDITRGATVSVGENAIIDASQGNAGIFLRTVANGDINIGHGANIMGGKDAGINFGIELGGTSQYTINSAGFIGSENDKAISISGSTANSQVALNNTGVIQGYITSNNETALNMDNTGQFMIRNQNNNTKNTAISYFNGGTVNNTGIIQLMPVNGMANTDITGEYTPTGAVSNINDGIEHGQLLGVKDFNHSGVLDIRGSGLSGNVFVITGDKTAAGNNGNGNFTSNGGVLKVTTTLNEGGANSRSDMLIVDNIKKGSAATKIDVTIAAGSTDHKTVDSGIQIIKTLGTQETDSFELAQPVSFGRYEYLLFGDNAAGTADGYYLRNKLKDPVDPTKPTIYLPNPNIGAYLGNQYAAANMFNQNILDRRDNVQSPDQTVWARINYNKVKANHINGTQKLRTDNTLLQIGVDLYQDKEKGRVAGTYLGYGKSDTDNTSYLTGSKAEGDVRGLQIGAYYSWMPEEDNGPYIDVWGHYADYSSKLKGTSQKNRNVKYNGYGWALSTEGGYSFTVKETDTNKWIFKPHAQLTYNHISMDNFTDNNNTHFSNNKSHGFQARLGARFYGHKLQTNGVLPFAEANWLHNGMSNKVAVNGYTESSKMGNNVGEVKVGLQGNISENSSLFAHIGYQKGDHRYKRTSGQIGYNYNWK